MESPGPGPVAVAETLGISISFASSSVLVASRSIGQPGPRTDAHGTVQDKTATMAMGVNDRTIAASAPLEHARRRVVDDFGAKRRSG